MDQKEKILKNIKSVLAAYLGVEEDDISDDDSFTDDLNMEANDLSEFIEKLSQTGVDTKQIDFSEISSVNELADAIESNL